MKHDLGHKNLYQPHLSTSDTFLESLQIKLTEDQQLYLNAHKHEKRTILAKKLGIHKYQLNHILHTMLPTNDEANHKRSRKMHGNKNAKAAV